MSDEDYLKQQKKKSLEDQSNVSEAELHASNESIKEGWQAIQDLKRKIFDAKKAAVAKVDEEFKQELKDLEDTYALLITLTR